MISQGIQKLSIFLITLTRRQQQRRYHKGLNHRQPPNFILSLTKRQEQRQIRLQQPEQQQEHQQPERKPFVSLDTRRHFQQAPKDM